MSRKRRSYESGHQAKFLVVVDDTPECDRALYFASRRAARVGINVIMLRVIDTHERNQQWLGVADIMRAEAHEEAQQMLARAAARANGIAGVTPEQVIREGDTVYNRLIWASPDGSLAYYDKRHLFRMAGEHTRYGGGNQRLIVTLKGWRILPQVCYDLRFPVWLRNGRRAEAEGGMDYDLALFVANWPAPRRQPWRTLLRARAIENLAYVIGVNRVGIDGNDHPYAGDSAIIDPIGEALLELGPQEQVVTTVLDPAPLQAHRERFPAWMDADAFSLSP
jgi:predicted amidohydrolase